MVPKRLTFVEARNLAREILLRAELERHQLAISEIDLDITAGFLERDSKILEHLIDVRSSDYIEGFLDGYCEPVTEWQDNNSGDPREDIWE